MWATPLCCMSLSQSHRGTYRGAEGPAWVTVCLQVISKPHNTTWGKLQLVAMHAYVRKCMRTWLIHMYIHTYSAYVMLVVGCYMHVTKFVSVTPPTDSLECSPSGLGWACSKTTTRLAQPATDAHMHRCVRMYVHTAVFLASLHC